MKIRYKWFKKFMICFVTAAATCMLITADRETSQIHNRRPMLELSVVRVSDIHFRASFLGHEKDIEAEPIEKLWNRIQEEFKGNSVKDETWQETVLCTRL